MVPCDAGHEDSTTRRQNLDSRDCFLLGHFHSHPISEAIPSPGYLKEAPLYSYQLIYDVCGSEARLWFITKRAKRKVALEVPLHRKLKTHQRTEN